MTRILLSTDAVGGVWRYSLELARGLALHGAEVVLAVLGPGPDAGQRREAEGIADLIVYPTGLPLDWTADSPVALDGSAFGLARLARQAQADSVQLHSPALMGSAFWSVPVIVAVHSCVATWWQAVCGGPLPSDLKWRAAATAHGLAAADVVIVPSMSFAKALRECYRLKRRIDIIPNGRRPLQGQGQRRLIALTVGRLWDEGKGVATLDAAAERLSAPVLAAGPITGPHGARIAYRHLQLRGTLSESELAREYASASVFVSVARYEPFGLAALEAAQSGCALVLSDIATFRELWDGVAVFVPPDQPVHLANAIQHLLDDPAECARRGARAQVRAERFDPMRMAAATWDMHSAVLKQEAN
jgi:glycosyltransferase involved in cell wall biosynthesis